MPQPRHLRNAPITEAIIDFRVQARSDFRPEDLSALKATLADPFPKVEECRGGQVTFQFTPSGARPPALEDLGMQGYFFKSEDEKLVAQFRVDGFTLNRLKPYTSWDELFPLAMGLWEHYHTLALPQTVTRLALRYINQVPLPSDLSDLKRCLRAAPSVPPELPQLISAFFSRITIHDREKSLAAHVSQALSATDPTRTALLLDIDAFRDVDRSPEDPEIRATLLQLHDFKNLVFFSYLTDEVLRSFE